MKIGAWLGKATTTSTYGRSVGTLPRISASADGLSAAETRATVR